MSFSPARMRSARRRAGLTQMGLAKAMGADWTSVSAWENGRHLPTISKLEDLARALGISVGSLFDPDEEPADG